MTISYPTGLMPAIIGPDGRVTPGSPVIPAGGTADYHRATGTHPTWYVGARAQAGYLYAEVLLYHDVYEQGAHPGGDVGLTGGKTTQVVVGIQIPL